jgi:hypothetical protein
MNGLKYKFISIVFPRFSEKSTITYDEKTDEMKREVVNLWSKETSPAQLKHEFASLQKVFQSYRKKLLSDRKRKDAVEKTMLEGQEEEFEIFKIPSKMISMKVAFQEILQEYSTDFPSCCQLIQMMLVYPTNSAGPERIFSEQTFLKTKLRSRLGDVTLNDLIHIRKNSLGMSEANFGEVMKHISTRAPTSL